MAIYKSNIERENKAWADSSNMYATKPGFARGAEQEPPTGRATLPVKVPHSSPKRLPSLRMK
jgi:hypothetical protein